MKIQKDAKKSNKSRHTHCITKQITILLLALSLLLSCGKKKERILHLKAINPATGAVYLGLDCRVTATKMVNGV